MKRILCIGNRFIYPDNFGMLVYDTLKNRHLQDIEVVEGGLGGLNLSPYFEDDSKLLIVDFAQGFDKKILTQDDIKNIKLNEYNHDSAFLYLLKSVDKDYKIYIQNKEFDEVELEKSVNEIMEIIKCM